MAETVNTHTKSNLYAGAQFVLIAIFALVFFFAPGAMLFARHTIIGSVLGFGGLIFIVAALVSLRDVIQVQPEPKAGGHLVTSGVYGRFRHPIYTGIAIVVVGLFLCKPAMFVAIMSVVFIAFLVIKSRFEERLLRERYTDYDAYRKNTWGVL